MIRFGPEARERDKEQDASDDVDSITYLDVRNYQRKSEKLL